MKEICGKWGVKINEKMIGSGWKEVLLITAQLLSRIMCLSQYTMKRDESQTIDLLLPCINKVKT